MSQVWVNGKFFTSENKKSSKWNPAEEQKKKFWSNCDCGETIYEGDPVGMVADHVKVVCYSCWLEGNLPEGHLDAAGLQLPDVTLSH